MGAELVRHIANSQNIELSQMHPDPMHGLLSHLIDGVKTKLDHAAQHGDSIEVLDPEWCRVHPEAAGRMHAEIILHAYGPTYALPNKNPEANARAIDDGSLNLYLMKTNGVLTGTACLVDMHDGRAELGRAASLGHSRNGVIQDLRIIDWLSNDDIADKYHTLFSTLRNAPDRHVHTNDGANFIMRGGQAVTRHWKKFPDLRVYGIAPLYLKARKLEQFTYSAVARTVIQNEATLHVLDETHQDFVSNWHMQYGINAPIWEHDEDNSRISSPDSGYSVHYPPPETGLTTYVHADIASSTAENSQPIGECIREAEEAGSPFIQVEVPVQTNTIGMQHDLISNGFKLYGYRPGTDYEKATILLGRLRQGIEVVPTFWDSSEHHNPFWHSHLGSIATQISRSW